MNAQNIVETATSLQSNHNKIELVAMARSFGWKGDHARAPVLQLALFIATKLAAGERWQPEQQQPEQQQPEQQQPEQQQPEQQQEAPQGENGDQGQQPEEETPPPVPDNEFAQLLAKAGINAPHRLLEKVWRLSTKARQNVLLVGPAGSGKTMLAQQLAQLLSLPFGSISCTMGMSESQLTGWLLPVGKKGKFDYVPAPFVSCIQQPSVFLLDELDAADPNVLMLMNSVLSNGFCTIPHKLDTPTVYRHEQAVVIAGANTVGTGADDLYSARAALDASTLDRFYPVVIDYDEAYEHSLFAMSGKSRKRAERWEAATPPQSQDEYTAMREWFFRLRSGTARAKLNKVISSRMAQRLIAAAQAGIAIEEVKKDLLIGWSADELARTGV